MGVLKTCIVEYIFSVEYRKTIEVKHLVICFVVDAGLAIAMELMEQGKVLSNIIDG
ncbi:hypothetical protein ACJX0J_030072, partial [Zea mays]